MAKEVVVFDLDNMSSDPKIVKVDIGTLIQTRQEGEEKWLLKFYTYEYSDAELKSGIKSIYLDQLSSGWFKSSGLVNTSYTITDQNDSLNVQIDGSIGIYTIVLEHGQGLKGSVVANDIKRKINAIPDSEDWIDGEDIIKFSYVNCIVKYKDDKFYILSGSSGAYSGSESSTIRVFKVSGDNAYNTLGFNLGISSEEINMYVVTETLLLVNYISDTDNLIIGPELVPSNGEVCYITDNVNEDYFVCLSGSIAGNIKVQTTANNSYIGIKHGFLAGETKIQLLKPNDPDFNPTNYTSSVDDMIKWGINSIANKIDYTG